MITKELLDIRDSFRREFPDVVSIGFRFSPKDKPIMYVHYWKDEEFPLFYKGIPVVPIESGRGVTCN